MCPKVIQMFGFQSMIFNLLTWLAVLVPQETVIDQYVQRSISGDIITAGHIKSPAIVELISNVNQLLDNTSQDSKIPEIGTSHTYRQDIVLYEPTLLYFHIGNAIELELTSTAIIFPFHCFT